ncbi:MAG TPA: hypothetical protein VGX49_12160 [Jatrophihabitans sp.]|jgi:outer membrane lipoprotein-sorting protein|nr:hypothetical protein [Jatrophihabitans sp.]
MPELSTDADPGPRPDAAPRPDRDPRRHWRLARWLAPTGVAAVIALLASGVLSADANPNLPPQSAAQLLAAIGNAKLTGFSGTVVEKASLGLPELPTVAGADPATGLAGLLTGSHTIRLWYGGETKQRIALLSSLGEQDLFRNGRELWQWNSETRTANHTVLPSDASGHPGDPRLPVITPDEAARRALAMIDPSTAVSTDRAAIVAGRPAYVLVLRPRDDRSRVGSVRISVDGKTKIPLGVQVLARGSDRAAIDITFTRFHDSMPSQDNFDWTPPDGAMISQASPPRHPEGYRPPAGLGPDVSTIGTGWTTITKLTGVSVLPGSGSGSESGSQGDQFGSLLAGLPEVSGSWGSGRLLRSALLSALITSDGRVYVGAVDPELLYAAAATK